MRQLRFVLFALALAVSACQNKGQGGSAATGGKPFVSSSGGSAGSSDTSSTVVPPANCHPTSIVIYDDFSSSVNNAIALEVKENFVKSLEREYVPCLASVQLVRFGVGSVWSSQGKRHDFPPTPSCGEPDYKQLAAHVRNLTAYRDQLRRDHIKQCGDQDDSFKEKYASAVAALKADLLSQTDEGEPNRCTSFANLIERIHDDISATREDVHFVIISDMKWSCDERKPAPLLEKGTIIQIADGRTDDRIKVSPLNESDKLKGLFPNASVLQGVHAERAVATLMTEVETLTARR